MRRAHGCPSPRRVPCNPPNRTRAHAAGTHRTPTDPTTAKGGISSYLSDRIRRRAVAGRDRFLQISADRNYNFVRKGLRVRCGVTPGARDHTLDHTEFHRHGTRRVRWFAFAVRFLAKSYTAVYSNMQRMGGARRAQFGDGTPRLLPSLVSRMPYWIAWSSASMRSRSQDGHP